MKWRRNRGRFAPLFAPPFTHGETAVRFEATIIAAKSAGDMADAEAALLAECSLAGRSIEFLGSSDVDQVRIYRIS